MAQNGKSYDWKGERDFVMDKRVLILVEALSLRI
jgi:hypothetical protein